MSFHHAVDAPRGKLPGDRNAGERPHGPDVSLKPTTVTGRGRNPFSCGRIFGLRTNVSVSVASSEEIFSVWVVSGR